MCIFLRDRSIAYHQLLKGIHNPCLPPDIQSKNALIMSSGGNGVILKITITSFILLLGIRVCDQKCSLL